MSYLSLYRKWRSQNFDEIVGQPAIVQTLKNAVKNNRLAHAYLFSGPRGTGKTSTARILAKALNCRSGPTPDPCGKCDSCVKIRDGHSVNVIEIDAASNRGIDEIRELRERVRYSPVEGNYKVYIIDEVHMLTPEAFNALLKTLEEPPSHIIFILATTELQKVPATISSRCQRLDFGRITLGEIQGQLKKIVKAEGFEIEEKALNYIAVTAEGSMRDALSLLDQLTSFAGEKVTYDDIVTALGTADEELLFAFGEAVAGNDTAGVLKLIEKGMSEGRSVPQVTRDIIAHFRNLLHLKVGAGEELELSSEYYKKLEEQAEKFPLSQVKGIIKALARAELDMKWHPHARLVLEVALIEFLGEAKQERVNVQVVEGPLASENIRKVKTHWKDILESVKKKSVFGFVSLHEGEPQEINEKGKLVIAFRKGYAFHKERLEEQKNKDAVEEAVREVVGQKVPIECILVEGRRDPGISASAVAEFFEGRIIS